MAQVLHEQLRAQRQSAGLLERQLEGLLFAQREQSRISETECQSQLHEKDVQALERQVPNIILTQSVIELFNFLGVAVA